MKYKKLSKEQLIISIDRITRFKNTKTKYFRVFSDIILSCLIEPSYKKTDLESMDSSELTAFVEEILNNSIHEFNFAEKNDYKLNELLRQYENTVYNNDAETQNYLNNKIDYLSFLPLIDESCPINLRWLKSINFSDNIRKLRTEKGLKFPIEKVVLVEGITEEILLPAFSKYLGYDFYREGVQIIPAGGKNQVVKMYYNMAEELKLPIFLLLDKDAEENILQIKPRLRQSDKIHLVACGEFEDLLSKSLIIKTVNNELTNFAQITENDLLNDIPRAKNLENIFKTKGLHEFKKAEFAKLVRDNITQDSDISAEIADIVMEIGLSTLDNKILDSKFCSC